MTTTAADLVGLIVGILQLQDPTSHLYPTDAGPRVYAPRDWPSWDSQYPVVFVSAPEETKTSMGRHVPQFTVVVTARLSIRVAKPAVAGDGSAGQAEAQLWAIQRQLEVALINAYAISLPIQQFPTITTRLAYSSEGALHLAGLVMEVGLEFYQGYEDFAPIVATDLTEVAITADLIAPFDPTGTYASPAFPASVQPAPRTSGPDGRAEGAADIILP